MWSCLSNTAIGQGRRESCGMIDFCATRSTWVLFVDRGIDERTAGLRSRHGIDGNQANDAAFDASTAYVFQMSC